jgi:hypothetical protein
VRRTAAEPCCSPEQDTRKGEAKAWSPGLWTLKGGKDRARESPRPPCSWAGGVPCEDGEPCSLLGPHQGSPLRRVPLAELEVMRASLQAHPLNKGSPLLPHFPHFPSEEALPNLSCHTRRASTGWSASTKGLRLASGPVVGGANPTGSCGGLPACVATASFPGKGFLQAPLCKARATRPGQSVDGDRTPAASIRSIMNCCDVDLRPRLGPTLCTCPLRSLPPAASTPSRTLPSLPPSDSQLGTPIDRHQSRSERGRLM